MVQVQQQILAAPANPEDALAHEGSVWTAQWPPQGFPLPNGKDVRPGYAIGKTQASDFDFRQFRHGQARWVEHARLAWIIMD
jgi:hypothetical protein